MSRSLACSRFCKVSLCCHFVCISQKKVLNYQYFARKEMVKHCIAVG